MSGLAISQGFPASSQDPELVADAVADRRTLQSGQRVQVARGEPAEAAVAQPRFLLAGQHRVEVLAHRRQRVPRRPLHAQIQHGLHRRHPAVLHAVTHGQRRRPVVTLGTQGGGRPADRVTQVVGDGPLQRGRAHPGAGMLDQVGPGGAVRGDSLGGRLVEIGHDGSSSLREHRQAVSVSAVPAHQARNGHPPRERLPTRGWLIGVRAAATSRRHGVPQWAPERFSVTTPAMIRPTPTTLATDRGEPRNSTAISTIAAVPIADHSA